jgi:hypothetical protein
LDLMWERERERGGGGGNFFYITKSLFLSLGDPNLHTIGTMVKKKP